MEEFGDAGEFLSAPEVNLAVLAPSSNAAVWSSPTTNPFHSSPSAPPLEQEGRSRRSRHESKNSRSSKVMLPLQQPQQDSCLHGSVGELREEKGPAR